jgi:hypothetical protein
MTVLVDTYLDVEYFKTEQNLDVLYVNGVAYSGNNGPDNVFVRAGDSLTFTSDASISYFGFYICSSYRTFDDDYDYEDDEDDDANDDDSSRLQVNIIAAVFGGVFGGFCLLFILTVTCILCCRRKNNNDEHQSRQSDQDIMAAQNSPFAQSIQMATMVYQQQQEQKLQLQPSYSQVAKPKWQPFDGGNSYCDQPTSPPSRGHGCRILRKLTMLLREGQRSQTQPLRKERREREGGVYLCMGEFIYDLSFIVVVYVVFIEVTVYIYIEPDSHRR